MYQWLIHRLYAPRYMMYLVLYGEIAMNTACRFPMTIALAEKFLWEVFLTEKWDNIFRGDENTGLPIFPRQLSFCPTKRSWTTGSGMDACVVTYTEQNVCSRVTVGMRYNRKDEVVGLLWPSSISFDLKILSIPLTKQLGIERLITERIEVRRS